MPTQPSPSELKIALRQMDEYDFEQFIADLWARQGWNTSVTTQSSDRGIDIIARRKEGGFETTTAIQAKRYQASNKVGSPAIQQYGSLHKQADVDLVVIVTTSSYSKQAKSIADDLNVKIVDGDDLLAMIDEYGAEDLILEYAKIPNEVTETSINSNYRNGKNRIDDEIKSDTFDTLEDTIEGIQNWIRIWKENLPDRSIYGESVPFTLWTFLIYATLLGWIIGLGLDYLSPAQGTNLYYLIGLLGLVVWPGLALVLFIDPHTVSKYSDWRPNPLFYAGLGLIPYLNLVVGLHYLYRRHQASSEAVTETPPEE